MRLIVGLGNPGQAYVGTRHNAGFLVVEALAADAGLKFRRHGEAAVARGHVGGDQVTLVKPQTYMNRSGPVVAALVADLALDLGDVLVVHDDLDLDPGRLRIKSRGGAGGHNGVLSLIDALGSDRFARLKVGIGRPPAGDDAAEYVLAPLPSRERTVLDDAVQQAVQALECWIAEGLMAAMNRFNVKPD
ncbi:MAG: aminoacyl-tRNA hydrolase [Nitrospirae bacterium]|nr:MAG: aminoacyl-tRNA hydrolase [Nitrospirota bacterium]